LFAETERRADADVAGVRGALCTLDAGPLRSLVTDYSCVTTATSLLVVAGLLG